MYKDLDTLLKSLKACAHHPQHDCDSCEYVAGNLICLNDEMLEDLDEVFRMVKESTQKNRHECTDF